MNRISKVISSPWFFRRIALVWAGWLSTVIVFKTFDNLTLIGGVQGTLIGTFFGVLTTVVAWYHRDRQGDNGQPAPFIPPVSELPAIPVTHTIDGIDVQEDIPA